MTMNYSIVGEIQSGLLDSMKAVYNPECTDVHVYINSPGGSLVEGLAITKWLQEISTEKKVVVEAYLAYSAASIIFLGYGFERKKADNAPNNFLMIHKPTLYGMTAEELAEATDVMQQLESQMIQTYVDGGMDKDEAIKLVEDETFFNENLAKQYQILAIKQPVTNMAEKTEGLLDEVKTLIKNLSDVFGNKVKNQEEEMTEESTPNPLEIEIEDLKAKLAAKEAECEKLMAELSKKDGAMTEALAQFKALETKIKAVDAKADKVVTPAQTNATVMSKAEATRVAREKLLEMGIRA